MLNEGFLLPFFSPIFALALTKNIKNEVQQATTAISFSSLVAHTHCPCWDAALLLQQHQNTVSEAPACFKSPCTSTILKFRTAGIFSWHCTLRHTASKWTVILREEENKIPVPKQGSTVILLLHPNQDVTYQVLKAPCLCTGRGSLSQTPAGGQLSAELVLGAFTNMFQTSSTFPPSQDWSPATSIQCGSCFLRHLASWMHSSGAGERIWRKLEVLLLLAFCGQPPFLPAALSVGILGLEGKRNPCQLQKLGKSRGSDHTDLQLAFVWRWVKSGNFLRRSCCQRGNTTFEFSRKIQNSLVGMKAKVHLGKQKACLEGDRVFYLEFILPCTFLSTTSYCHVLVWMCI